MRTEVEELPGSKVRIEAEVDAADVEARVERAARELAREMRVPGFRKGKAPPPIVLQRLGRGPVVEQAMRDALPEWYERALLEGGINPVGEPKVEVSRLPEEGEPLGFTVEVAVRPRASLGDYRGLEVGRAEPEVPAAEVDAELDRMRDGLASLTPVEREAARGDFLLVDYAGEMDGEALEGAEAHDFLLELGSESLLEGFDEGLAGATAGERRKVAVTFPDDYRPERLAGKEATFEVAVKEVREKRLPELDDDFAAENSDFETLAELREDIESRLRHVAEHRAEDQFREAAVDAAVEASEVVVPDEVAAARATEIWERVERQLSARGMQPETYLRMQGKTREEMIEDAREDAERGLKREAVLAAVADEEEIEVSEEEMLAALDRGDGDGDADPAKLLERLRAAGRDGLLREEIALRKAADAVVEAAEPIPLERAEARERLWTPDKERDERGGLWTPGDGPADRE